MKDVHENLIGFLRKVKDDTGCGGFVIGLSGGLDSAVVTKLAVDAIGPENVLNVFMPTSRTPAGDGECTRRLSELWGTKYLSIDITSAVDEISRLSGATDRIDIGNISSRVRMTVLYSKARMLDYLVLGTSNKSELMMGYFTKNGDGACDLSVISDLFKTQVRELAEFIDVPKEIISRPPSAGLWEGQTDEDEMGISYDELDVILSSIEKGERVSTDIDPTKIQSIKERVIRNAHKRTGALTPPKIY